jgi:hypothetical protein
VINQPNRNSSLKLSLRLMGSWMQLREILLEFLKAVKKELIGRASKSFVDAVAAPDSHDGGDQEEYPEDAEVMDPAY